MSSNASQPSPAAQSPPEVPFFAPIIVSGSLLGVLLYYYSVPLCDWAFMILFPLYILIINIIRFDSNSVGRSNNVPVLTLGKGTFLGQPGFAAYMAVFQVSAVLLPLSLIMFTTREMAEPCVPSLVLLLVQINVENLAMGKHCHDLPRLLIPIGFSTYRLTSIYAWVMSTWHQQDETLTSQLALGLAVWNMVIWSYNLFFFLLLRIVPMYLDEKDSPSVPVDWKLYLFPVKEQQNDKKKE